MNAPTNLPAMRSWMTPEEVETSERFERAMNIGSTRAESTQSEDASYLFEMVNRLASQWAPRRLDPEDRKMLMQRLTELFLLATLLERIEGRIP